MMKWWGWGAENWTFPMNDKPNLWPWMKNILGLTADHPTTLPVDRSKILLPEPILNEDFCQALSQVLKANQILIDENERLLHSYGKSFPDLFYVRKGHVHRAPDMILLPERHEDIVPIVRLAHQHDVCLVPFGGGTNIVGGVDPIDRKKRMVVSVDLRRMNHVLSIDPVSMTAVIEGGILGPKLEADLQAKGWSLGHYPDSFEYSTLGGWLATRSAGMQSDAYGKIEDMVVSLKVVTPQGTLVTRTIPKSSAGPDLNQVMVGSEGTLGIITEAVMKIHPTPEVKDYRGFLFKSFDDAVNATYECVRGDCLPSMIRIQDAGETQLAMQLKSPPTGIKALVQKLVKARLKRIGYDRPCIMVVGFEGTAKNVEHRRSLALPIFKSKKAFPLGTGVGKTWSKDKFNVPYLRDVVMDHGVMVDVAETSAVWKNLLPLYHNTIASIRKKFADEGYPHFYLGCHLSHTYKSGACLYFTWAAKTKPGNEIQQYYGFKYKWTQVFHENQGTLSHHHAVGYEHLPWMTQEVSPTGIKILQGIKSTVDPKGIFNPGKLIPETQQIDTSLEKEVVAAMCETLRPLEVANPQRVDRAGVPKPATT